MGRREADAVKRGFGIVALAFWFAGTSSPLAAQAPSPPRNEATRALYALFNSRDGRDNRPRGEASWPDLRLETFEQSAARDAERLDALKKIDRSQLSHDDQLNYDLFRRSRAEAVEAARFRAYLIPITQRDGVQTLEQGGEGRRPRTVAEYEVWIRRMRAFPTYIDQTIALMREGMRVKIVGPKVVLARVPAQIDTQIPRDPAQSPFFRAFLRFPENIPESDRRRLSDAGRAAVAESVIPAYRKLKTFFVDEYLPACYADVGLWQRPDGDDYYAFLVRRYTTTDQTPAQIHALGLSEVKRIRAELERVKTRCGFKGTLAQFYAFLRTDPRFYYKSPDELLTAYRALTKRIDPRLPRVFRTLPRTPYGVEPVPAVTAPDTTTAYYGGNTYFVNLYKPEARPKYEMMALSLHESVPGHHLQMALAQEMTGVPGFRRGGGPTAFVEGWGLYAESLGEDMGLYDDPYDKFGQLTYEMWRAIRLVVDTGMHSMRWTRQQAIDYFKENAAKTDLDIVNEIDRYITMPGQAVAYKVGELKIKALRARAERALGGDFDLREFHDVILRQGAIPLDLLEKTVDDWLQSKAEKRT